MRPPLTRNKKLLCCAISAWSFCNACIAPTPSRNPSPYDDGPLERAYLIFPERRFTGGGGFLPREPLIFIPDGSIRENVLEGHATSMEQLLERGLPPPKLPGVDLPWVEEDGVVEIALSRSEIGSATHLQISGSTTKATLSEDYDHVLRIEDYDETELRWSLHKRGATGTLTSLFEEVIPATSIYSTAATENSVELMQKQFFAYELKVHHLGKGLSFRLWTSFSGVGT